MSDGSGHSNTSLKWCAHLAAFFALLPRMGRSKSPPMSATWPRTLSSKTTERQGAWLTSAAAAALPRARSAHRRQRCTLLHLARRLPHIRRTAHRHHTHVRPCGIAQALSSHEHDGHNDGHTIHKTECVDTISARQRKCVGRGDAPPPKTWLKFCSRFLNSILKYFISSSTLTTSSSARLSLSSISASRSRSSGRDSRSSYFWTSSSYCRSSRPIFASFLRTVHVHTISNRQDEQAE